MSEVLDLIYAANDLTLNVKRGLNAPEEHSNALAMCIKEAKAVRVLASKVALSLPPGRDRSFAQTMRNHAVEYEKGLKRRLGISTIGLGSN